MPEVLRRLVGRDHATVPEVLEARANLTPDAPFILFHDRRLTYGEAWLCARRVAGFLLGTEYGAPGRRVASFLTNSPRTLVTWWGVQCSGAALVPIHRAHRGPILADMLTRSGARLLVTENSALEDLPDLKGCGIEAVLIADRDRSEAPSTAGIRSFAWIDVKQAAPTARQPCQPGDLAEVMYTSGTTGRSKAVRCPHNQFCRGGAWVAEALSISQDDVFHLWLPMYHIAGQLDGVMATMVGGGSVALLEHFSRSRFWDEVHQYGATLFMGFTSLLEMLLGMPPSPRDPDSSLRAGVIGHVPAAIGERFERRFGLQLFDTYGMTEAEPITTPVNGEVVPPGSCGRATPDWEVAIADELGNLLPAGTDGEIVARPRAPDVMMQGYENDADATAAAFRNLWLHTGDLGYLDEGGFLFFKDRLRYAIRRRGENISSWEVKNVVCSHPDIEEAVAVGVPSSLGDEDVKIVVIPSPGARPTPAEIHAWCQSEMARFMVPRYIEVRSDLPVTDTGKVQHDLLRELGEATWDAEDPTS